MRTAKQSGYLKIIALLEADPRVDSNVIPFIPNYIGPPFELQVQQ